MLKICLIVHNAGLHYVPGSYGSQKRSSPWCFESFLRFFTLCQGLPCQRLAGALPSVTDGSTFPPACHVLLGTLTFCYVAIKFCYVYQVLSRFSTMNRGQ